jgi:hypothetical protein
MRRISLGLLGCATAVPKIGGQHYEYLRRQIYDAVDGRRPGLPASHVRLLARLDQLFAGACSPRSAVGRSCVRAEAGTIRICA